MVFANGGGPLPALTIVTVAIITSSAFLLLLLLLPLLIVVIMVTSITIIPHLLAKSTVHTSIEIVIMINYEIHLLQAETCKL